MILSWAYKILIFIFFGWISVLFLIIQSAPVIDIMRVALSFSLLGFSLVYLWGFRITYRVLAILLIVTVSINLTLSFNSYYYYDSIFGDTTASSLLNTNKNEAFEFLLEHKISFIFLCFIVIFSVTVLRLITQKTYFLNYRIYFYAFISLNALMYTIDFCRAKVDLGGAYKYNEGIKYFRKTVLYNMPYILNVLNEKHYIQSVVKLSKYSFYPKGKEILLNKNNKLSKFVAVIVIGESARRDRLGLFNYSLSTTPLLLDRNKNIALFNQANSPASQTILSVPASLTVSDIKNLDLRSLNKNIIALLNESGFQTVWISQQGFEYGASESHISAIAQHANHKISPSGIYDESVIPHFIKYLNEDQKTVIFIHLQGSHPSFKRRYPKQFNNFKLTNSLVIDSLYHYDMSIRYTDYVLDKIIQKLEGRNSVLMYFSDHGLQRRKGTFKHGAHSPTQETYEVPFLIWQSDRLKKQKEINLSHINKQFNTQDIFFTIADLLDIHGYQGETVCKSILQSCYQEPLQNIVVDDTLTYHSFNDLIRETPIF